MALRGIDAQIMVVRAAELSTTQVRTMREHDTSQSIFAAQMRAQSELNKSKPLATVRTEGVKIDVNAERDRKGNGSGKKKSSHSNETDEFVEQMNPNLQDLPVTPSKNKLDIKV